MNNSNSIRTFNTVSEMQNCTDLTEGTVCETLGFYTKHDGGGAKYTIITLSTSASASNEEEKNTPNGCDIIAIGTDTIPTLAAKFLYENKPINVLQFGAKNSYKSLTNNSPPIRNDSIAIQRAIDYINTSLKEGEDPDYYNNNVNTIIVPGGNYFICDQIKMPPYIRMQLDGDVQFLSFMTADEDLYRYDSDNKAFVLIEDIYEDGVLINSYADQIYNAKEVFARTDRFKHTVDGETVYRDRRNLYDEEYYVYKKGAIKICYNLDKSGIYIDSPYANENGPFRYMIAPQVESEIFCGNGTLTIHNKMCNGDKKTCYLCGIEVGSAEEYIGLEIKNKGGKEIEIIGEDKILTKSKRFGYSYLRFSNIKIYNFHIGFLSHLFEFYSNSFKDMEFHYNNIGFQCGVYGQDELIKTVTLDDGNTYTTGILGLPNHNSGELSRFRDCLFTGNKISVRTMLSGFSVAFDACHFDFDNCIFHAPYRTNIIVDKCHIEGIGKALQDKYFPGKVITSPYANQFKDRKESDPEEEFVGIIYAKPITKFDGNTVAQYSYVDLSITNSRIIDSKYLTWSLFSFYNSGTAEYSDGHHRSRLYLCNNTYGFYDSIPVNYMSFKDEGIVHSGFLLSEFPEVDIITPNLNDKTRMEKFANQNVPVICRDNGKWGSFSPAEKTYGNHRFLSNRTLANKYPYFQNVTSGLSDILTGGVDISFVNAPEYFTEYPEVYAFSARYHPNPAFYRYDKNAKEIMVYGGPAGDGYNGNNEPVKLCIALNNDVIECTKGDYLCGAIVTDHIGASLFANNPVSADETYEVTAIPVEHSITFVELDKNGTELGRYEYPTPYQIASVSTDNYSKTTFPCTSACKHYVNNIDTKSVMIIANISIPMGYGLEENHFADPISVHAVLVEKNR